jgi:aminoglycoside phosphotransferase (APT) family kinase protein
VPTDYLDRPQAVRAGEELDASKLESYLKQAIPGLEGALEISQFPRGFSNLTYMVKVGGTELVLRRPPFGNRVKSAHDMGREYRILSKLYAIYPPAPRAYAYCEDESVLGAPFYVMERREGVVLRQRTPQGLELAPATVRRLCEVFVDNLVTLHGLDYRSCGLGDLGKPEGYVERQIRGWIGRYEKARTEEVPAMNETAGWLLRHMPDESGASLIHNDYKFDNVVLDPNDLTRIVAVLDWEMSTVGDPLMDLGTTLAYWINDDDPPSLQAFVVGPTREKGGLTRRELLDRYEAQSGRKVENPLYYFVFGVYKLAVVLQQIYKRYHDGATKDERFANFNFVVQMLAEGALDRIRRGTL